MIVLHIKSDSQQNNSEHTWFYGPFDHTKGIISCNHFVSSADEHLNLPESDKTQKQQSKHSDQNIHHAIKAMLSFVVYFGQSFI